MKRVGLLSVFAILLVLAFPAVALAQAYTGTTPPVIGSQDVNVLGVTFVAPEPTAQVEGVEVKAGFGALPVTGTDVAGLGAIALALIASGLLMQRRREASPTQT